MKEETNRMDRGKKPDRVLIERVIDFFKTYAHRCHYGKEEGILFHRLYLKRLLPEHKRIIDELVLEHIRERELLERLEMAKDRFWLGEPGAFPEIQTNLQDLLEFYPGHMQREGKNIFLPGMDYFSREEQEEMLREFARFDQNLIHEKYIKIADQFEGFLTPSEYSDRTRQLILQPEAALPAADHREEKK
jgi:hemerythrin-like domain-containing protein